MLTLTKLTKSQSADWWINWKRTFGYKRRAEAFVKATDIMVRLPFAIELTLLIWQWIVGLLNKPLIKLIVEQGLDVIDMVKILIKDTQQMTNG